MSKFDLAVVVEISNTTQARALPNQSADFNVEQLVDEPKHCR